MIKKMSKIYFMTIFLISSNAYAGSNTGGLFNNLAESLIAVFLIYELVKGNKKRIIGVTIYSLAVIAIGFVSPLYSGIAVLFTPLVALLIQSYFLRERKISPDLTMNFQKHDCKKAAEITSPAIDEPEVDKYLKESREAYERIKADPSIILSKDGEKKSSIPQSPHTKEVEYQLGGIPHRWDGSKFVQIKKQRD